MNTISKLGLKKIILKIRERIYFKDVKVVKNVRTYNTIIMTSTDLSTKPDMANYHEYYLKYKKAV